VYVEPFGGAASVLLRKERSFAELWNDLDDEAVNLFCILRDVGRSARLLEALRLTPFARREFELAYQTTDDAIERARRLIIRSFMGIGSVSNVALAGATGFRNNTTRSARSPFSTIPSHDWARYPDALQRAIVRLDGVCIENRDAIELMRQHDGDDVLFYCDPPYMPETRSRIGNRKGNGYVAYTHEIDRAGHVRLLDTLRLLDGMVALSGYPSPDYDELLPGWRRSETQAYADGARPRTECLWLNRQAYEALDAMRAPLFAGLAEEGAP
jgi:DNA adenine methylase